MSDNVNYKILIVHYLQFLLAEDFNLALDLSNHIHTTKNIVSGKMIIAVNFPENTWQNEIIDSYILAIIQNINLGHISISYIEKALIGFK